MSDAKKKWKHDINYYSNRRNSYRNSMEISSPMLSPSSNPNSNSLLKFDDVSNSSSNSRFNNNNDVDIRQPKAIVFSKNSADLQGI
jgi:hypothetical protein